MAGPEAARGALAAIDAALAVRPKRDGAALKSAVQGLADFRDRVVARHRADGGTQWRATLEGVNAVISVVLAVEFPIGEVRWDELEKARGWFAAILDREGGQ